MFRDTGIIPARHRTCDAEITMTLFHHPSTETKEEDASSRTSEAIVRVDRSGLQPSIIVTGRITVDSAPRLRTALLAVIAESTGLVVIDISGVTRIDMTGGATLLEALNYAHKHSLRLRLTGVSGQARKLAELTQLDQIYQALGSEVEFR
jgi:anti-anti-sigma factor